MLNLFIMAISYKNKHTSTLWASRSNPLYLHRRNEFLYPHSNNQKLEIAQMAISGISNPAVQHICTADYYSAIKRNDLLTAKTTWDGKVCINPKSMLSWFHCYNTICMKFWIGNTNLWEDNKCNHSCLGVVLGIDWEGVWGLRICHNSLNLYASL